MGYGAASGASGAPKFNTGNPMWDNNLNLAHSLFGDGGANAARGAALGAQTRKDLLAGDQSIAERNAAQWLAETLAQRDRTGQSTMPPQMTYHPSGVVGGSNIPDPPPGVPITQAPQAPQPQPGFLARLFHSGTTGTPPPVSSPAPNSGAPPAPNTTTSNGQTPQNEQGSGTLNYNGANPDGGGGRQYAPAAQPNGSPAHPPIGLGTLIGLATMAGMNPEMVRTVVGGAIGQGVENGQIPWHTANAIAGVGGPGSNQPSATQLLATLGNTAPYESVEQTARNRYTQDATTGRTILEQQGANYRTGLVEGGTNRRFDLTPLTSQGVDAETGRPTLQYPGTPQGTPQFNQAVADQQNQGVLVYQRRPDGSIDYVSPPVTVTLRQAQQQNLPRFIEGQRGGQPPADSKEAAARSDFVHTTFENAYTPAGAGLFGASHGVAATPTLKSEAAVTDYAEYLRDQSHGTMTVQQAYTTAQQELQRQGFLPTKEQVDNARQTHVFRSGPHPAQTTDADGNPTGWTIPLLKHYVSPRGDGHVIDADTNQSGSNISAEQVDTSTMRPVKPTVPSMPAPVAPAPARPNQPSPQAATSPSGRTALNIPVPTGWAEGTIHAGPSGQLVVLGGKVYPYP